MLRNSYYMLVSSLLRLMTQVALFVVLARVWGVERFGAFMYPFTVSTLVVIAVDYGFSLQLVRDIGRNPDTVGEAVSRAFWAKLVLSGVVLPIVILPVLLSGRSIVLLTLLLLAATVNSFGMLFSFPFRAIGRFEQETKVALRASVVHFVVVASLAWMRCGLVPVAAAFIAARAFYCAVAYRSYTQVTGCARLEPFEAKRLLATLVSGLPFAVHVSLGALYFQVDTLIIQRFLGAEGVGTYQAGLRVVLGGLLLTEVIANVYLPRLACVSDSASVLSQTGTQMTRHLLVLGALGSTALTVLARPVVRVIYGPEYAAVADFLPLMGVAYLLRCLCVSYGTMLTVADRQTIRAIGAGIALVISVTLNIVLIMRFGVRGAVLASILTHVFLLMLYSVFARMQTRSWLLQPRAAALLVLTVVVNGLIMANVNGSGRAGLAAGVCLLGLVLALGLRQQEWKRLCSALHRPACSQSLG